MKSVLRSSKFASHPVLLGLGTGACIGIAFLLPGTIYSAALGWLGVFGLVQCLHSKSSPYRSAAAAGITTYLLGFYWFYETTLVFSKSGMLASAALCLVFLLWHALQFLLSAALFRLLPAALEQFALRAALAWVPLELLWPRLFSWQLSHTQLAIPEFIQGAALFGTPGLSLIMVMSAEAVYLALFKRGVTWQLSVPAALMVMNLGYGAATLSPENDSQFEKLTVGVVQAERADRMSRERTLPLAERLRTLSDGIASEVDLIIWPERALREKVHESIGARQNDRRLPRFSTDVPLLTGVKTYRPPVKEFNSVMLIDADGTIPVPYHKRMLVPFGEFIPFRTTLESIGVPLPANGSTHVAGEKAVVFTLKDNKNVRIAPGICVEDMEPGLIEEAVKGGATLLVDLAAGRWTRHEIPLYQHELIASFRAVESRRSLVRVSARGPTSVISPFGKRERLMEVGGEGAAIAEAAIASELTPYSVHGDRPLWILMGLILGWTLLHGIIASLSFSPPRIIETFVRD